MIVATALVLIMGLGFFFSTVEWWQEKRMTMLKVLCMLIVTLVLWVVNRL
jgi:hypothetical protein